MAEKTVKTRVIQKHGTTAEWAADGAVIPKNGELVVEVKSGNKSTLHVGDGENPVGDTTTAWAKAIDVADWAKQSTPNHSHAYLPLGGGTVTGPISTSGLVLKSGTDYGTTLPTGSQTTGKLFFLKV